MKSTGDRKPPISVPPGGSGKLYGIVVVPESCPRGKSSFMSSFLSCSRQTDHPLKNILNGSNTIIPYYRSYRNDNWINHRRKLSFVCSRQWPTPVSSKTEGVTRISYVCRMVKAVERVRVRTTRQDHVPTHSNVCNWSWKIEKTLQGSVSRSKQKNVCYLTAGVASDHSLDYV